MQGLQQGFQGMGGGGPVLALGLVTELSGMCSRVSCSGFQHQCHAVPRCAVLYLL